MAAAKERAKQGKVLARIKKAQSARQARAATAPAKIVFPPELERLQDGMELMLKRLLVTHGSLVTTEQEGEIIVWGTMIDLASFQNRAVKELIEEGNEP